MGQCTKTKTLFTWEEKDKLEEWSSHIPRQGAYSGTSMMKQGT